MAFTNGYALSIGVGSYQYVPQANIPISVADAQAVSKLLCDHNVCGYLPEHVTLLRHAETSRAGILQALDNLAGQTSAEHTVILFYCGHGDYGDDGDYYLTTHDTQVANDKIVAGTGLNNAELLDKLRAIPAKRLLLIFNACHSGELSPHLGFGQAATSFGSLSLPQSTSEALLSTGEGRIIITASRPDQKSWVGSGPLTIFAQALVTGLSGQGYVTNSRGYVSAYGLYEHLYFTVKEAAAKEKNQLQEPELTVLKGVGPFPVSLYRGATNLGLFDQQESLPEGMAARTIDPARSQRLFNQLIKTITVSGERAVQVEGDVHAPIVTGNENRFIDTGGAAYIEGQVTTGGGDFVARDKVVNSSVFDQRGQTVGQQHNITGDQMNFSGNFQGALLNVRSNLSNVTQTIGALPAASTEQKQRLAILVQQLTLALEKAAQAPPPSAEQAEAVAEMAKALIDQANQTKPNRSLLKITADGLTTVAADLANPAVLTLSRQMIELITHMPT